MKKLFNAFIIIVLAFVQNVIPMAPSASTASAASAVATASSATAPVKVATQKPAAKEEAELQQAIATEQLASVINLLKANTYRKSFLENWVKQVKATIATKLKGKQSLGNLLKIAQELQSKIEQTSQETIDWQIKGLIGDFHFWFGLFGLTQLEERARPILAQYKPTLLMKEAFLGNEKAVIELLKTDAGTTINEQCTGKTALMLAALMNRKAVVKTLLAHGANTNLADDDGNTALHHATASHHLVAHKLSIHDSKDRFAIIDMLIQASALINARNIKGHTPLIHACMDIFENGTVEHLLNHGADAIMVDKKDQNSLTLARALARSTEAQKLATFFTKNPASDLPLNASTKILKALSKSSQTVQSAATQTDLKQKADYSKTETQSQQVVHIATHPTPLMLAVAQDDAALVKQYAQKPYAVHAVDKNLQTALHHAALNGASPQVINILILCGADVTCQDKDGATPIMLACCESRLNPNKNKLKTLKTILMAYNKKYIQKDPADIEISDYKPLLNVKDKKGRIALHYAIVHQDLSLTELLVQHDSDVLLEVEDCANALEFARKQRQMKAEDQLTASQLDAIIVLLKGSLSKTIHSFDMDQPFINIVRTENAPALEKALQKRAHRKNINNYDIYGKTALMYAAIEGNVVKLKMLVLAGADVHLKNKSSHKLPFQVMNSGHTAVHFAAMYNHLDALQYLHSQGADLNATTENNATALMFSIPNRSSELFDYLLTHGANPHTQTIRNATGLSLAKERYKTDNQNAHKKYMFERLEKIEKDMQAQLKAEEEALEKRLLEEKQRRKAKKERFNARKEQFKSNARSGSGSQGISPHTVLPSQSISPATTAAAVNLTAAACSPSEESAAHELARLTGEPACSPLTLAASPATPSAVSTTASSSAHSTPLSVSSCASSPGIITVEFKPIVPANALTAAGLPLENAKIAKRTPKPRELLLFQPHGSNQKKEVEEVAIANVDQLKKLFSKTKQEFLTQHDHINQNDLPVLLKFYEKEKQAYKNIATHMKALEKKKHVIDTELKKSCLERKKWAQFMHEFIQEQIDESGTIR